MYYLTYLMSSIVALFIGSTCNIWHKRLTTVLFKYSGIGKTPAKIKNYTISIITISKIQSRKYLSVYIFFERRTYI